MNENSMMYWYPRIKDLGIPTPDTILIPVQLDFDEICILVDGGKSDKVTKIYGQVKQAANKIGFPIFLRGSESANKHDWVRSCFVQNENQISSAMQNLAEFSAMVDISFDCLAVRKFLDLDFKFKAFNGMPVAAERRYFVKNKKVQCWHPYWPETSIKNPTSKDWLAELRELQTPGEGEVELLTWDAELIGETLGGYWSVDFCRHKNGTWYVTDMALGEQSYHWTTCRHAPAVQKAQYPNPLVDGNEPPEEEDYFDDNDFMIE